MKIKKNAYLDIHKAILKNNYNKAKNLLENDISPNKQTGNNNTPLHIATMQNNLEMIKLLQSYQANPNLKNSHEATPLHIAVDKKDNLRIINLLIKMGANINHIDRYGNTPLHIAIRSHGDMKIIKSLLKAGANPNAINDDLETPLSIAKKLKLIPCIKLLKSYRKQKKRTNITQLLKMTLRTTSKLKKAILIIFSTTIITAAIAISTLISKELSFVGILFAILTSFAMAIVCLGDQYYKIRKIQNNK